MTLDFRSIKRRHLLALLLAAFLLTSAYHLEHTSHKLPAAAWGDITPLLSAEDLSDADLTSLRSPAGLAPEAVKELRTRPDGAAQLETIHRCYFAPVDYTCIPNGPISREEWIVNADGGYQAGTLLAPLHDGDILVTFGTHTLGWRHGHAAIVVDAKQRLTLEALVLGEPACLQSADKWAAYPNFLLLRPRNMTPQERSAVAQWALTHLENVPYDPLVGLTSPKAPPDHSLPHATQCAHLVWSAYHHFGWDLDANGGPVVTPRDLTLSDQLEIIQRYGL